MFDMRGYWLPANVFDETAEFHRQPFLTLEDKSAPTRGGRNEKLDLLPRGERAPQHADTLTDHGNGETVLLPEPVDNILQSGIIPELEAVPERPVR